jgi:hypothetical protein
MIETNISRLQWTFRFILMAVLGTLLLSSKVWMTDRNFPVIPIFDGIPSMPSPLDYILYSVLIVLAIYQIIYLENRNTMYALIGMYAFLMAGDQMRWQPYNVQYLLVMIGLLFYPMKSDQLLAAFRFFIVAFYIWSGIQQLNMVFFQSIFPWLAGPLAEKFPSAMEEYVLGAGYVFPWMFLFTGVGLLIPKLRNIAVYVGLIIQLFLIYSFSPLGNDWNEAILPYNAALGLFTYLLFFNAEFNYREVFVSKFKFHMAFIIIFGILPVASFFGIYDRMQSFNTLSGKAYYGKIYVTEQLAERLPDGVKRYVFRPPLSKPFIETTYWSMDALKVSPYSEKRIYRSLETYICSFSEGDCDAELEIYTYEDAAN